MIRVNAKELTLAIISSNKYHVSGGYSANSWTEGVKENLKTWDESCLFTSTVNKGNKPEKLFLYKRKDLLRFSILE